MPYNETLFDHFERPRNRGNPAPDDTGRGVAQYPTCGDIAVAHVRVEDGRVSRMTWQSRGCGVVTACLSMLSTMVIGRSVDAALAITPDQLSDALGTITPVKMHAACIAVAATSTALTNSLPQAGGEAS